MGIRIMSYEVGWSLRKADNLTTFIDLPSWNLGVSNSWKPQGLSRPVMRLIYLLIELINIETRYSYVSKGVHVAYA
jgi:hypothetical protein